MNILTQAAQHEIFKALSEPVRLRIMALLSRRELCVCDLTAALDLPQPTISRHMNKLRMSQLVRSRREGRWIHYRMLTGSPLDELRPYLMSLAREAPFSEDLARLKQYQKEKHC